MRQNKGKTSGDLLHSLKEAGFLDNQSVLDHNLKKREQWDKRNLELVAEEEERQRTGRGVLSFLWPLLIGTNVLNKAYLMMPTIVAIVWMLKFFAK